MQMEERKYHNNLSNRLNNFYFMQIIDPGHGGKESNRLNNFYFMQI